MRWALVVLGTLVGLLVAEGAARLTEHVGCADVLSGFNVRDRRWGWGNRAGASGELQRCLQGVREWRADYRINHRGLREREIPHERSGAFRILVLGDSFTEGMQVDADRTYTRLLERRLQATAPPGVRIEVVNASVQGWGTDNELLFYRSEGWRYGADLVLLAFDTTNDVFENARSLVATSSFWADKPYFALADGRLRLEQFPMRAQPRIEAALRRLVAAAYRRSALVRLTLSHGGLMDVLALPPPPRPPGDVAYDPLQVYLVDYPEPWREAWRITRGIILELRRAVASHGSRFAVVVINAREEVASGRWASARERTPLVRDVACDVDKPNRLITRFLARRGIPTVALLDAFRRRFPEDASPGFFAFDMHWAPAGHELAADEIAAGLRARGLVPAAVR